MRLAKTAISLAMTAVIAFSSVVVSATSSIGMIGTNQALGSPLLNTNFNPEEFSPEENIIFGIFLSNFPIPLVDTYETAFNKGRGGSNGYGFRALKFAEGSEDTMINMLNHAMTNSKSMFKPLYIEGEEEIGNETNKPAEGEGEGLEGGYEVDVISGKQATLADFLTPSKTKIVTEDVTVEDNGIVRRITSGNTPNKFYISTDSYNASKSTMFDYGNAYDVSMLLANLSRAITGNTEFLLDGKKSGRQMFEDNLKRLTSEELKDHAKMYTDVYGNIVVKDPESPDTYLVVFPACANQYLTEKPAYNFINSVFVGPSYLDSSTENLQLKLHGAKVGGAYYNGGVSAIGGDGNNAWYQQWFFKNNTNKYVKPGTILMYYDSDTYVNKLGDKDVHRGNIFIDMVDASLEGKVATNTDLKIAVVGADKDSNLPQAIKDISNYYEATRNGIDSGVKMLYELNTLGKSDKKLSLFGDSVIIAPNTDVPDGSKQVGKIEKDKDYHIRMYIDYLGKLVSGEIIGSGEVPVPDSRALRTQLQTAKSWGDFNKIAFKNGDTDKVSGAFYSYLKSQNMDVSPDSKASSFGGIDSLTGYNRLIKVLKKSETMGIVSAILGGQEDAEFGRWTPMIYQTYLEWYGLIGKKTNKLNTSIFDADNFKMDPTEIVSTAKTDEEIKQLLANYIDVKAGRGIRYEVNMGALVDTVYGWYNNMVKSGGISGSSGFLNIDTYGENPLTATFFKYYSTYIIPIIGLTIIGIVISAILRKRNIAWIFLSCVAIINIVLVTPTIGDIVPFISSYLQDIIFKDKLDFWAISESVENAKIQSDEDIQKKYGESVSKEVYNLVKTFNTQNNDASLMLRWDISRKVTSTANGDLNDIQKYKSTRWMLPQIIGQYSSNDGKADYVYVGMTEALDNAKYMYWYYNQSDMLNGSSDDMLMSGDVASTSERISLYPKHVDTSTENYGIANLWENKDNPVHKSFYMLPDLRVPSIELTDDEDSIEEEIESVKNSYDATFRQAEENLEIIGGTYTPWEPDTVLPEYGYLWTTESPLTYFYTVIKDTFNTDMTLGSLVTELQGKYVRYENEETGVSKEVRESFMHHTNTGLIKDVVDLEELFTNLMPYMYTTQIVAGGLDGESGVFGDSLIQNYGIYTNNYKSWLFRSNWVTKLMESKITSSDKAKTADGVRFKVENPMLPESYTERPMVFSEAQMVEQGLSPFSLTKVELMIQEVNRRIVDRWTLLINYANLADMNKEIMYQQMALIATTEFNSVFSPGGLFSNTLALYPRSVELRNVSFDSIMRIIVLNSSRDTSFAYGDIMYNFIANSDIGSIIALLLVTFSCLYIMPSAKMLISAILLYVGIYSAVINIASSSRTKVTQLSAYLVDMGLFIVINALFYGGIAALMGITSPNDILRLNEGFINLKSPVLAVLAVGFLCILYCFAVFKMCKFLIKNKEDLGATKFTGLMAIANKAISGQMQNLTSGITDFITGDGTIGEFSEDKEGNSKNSKEDSKDSIKADYEPIDEDYVEDTDNETDFIDSEIAKGREGED